MKQMNLKSGTTLHFPEGWQEVTLGQHIEARKYLEQKAPPSTHLQGLLSALTRHPLPTIRTMTPGEAKEAATLIEFYTTSTAPIPADPITSFTHDGVDYEIPTDLSGRTFGEFIDLDTAIMSHVNDPKPGSSQQVVLEAMITYCRPVGELYSKLADGSPESIKALALRRKSFLNLPMTTVEGVASFFTNSGTASERAILLYGGSHLEAVRAVLTLRHSAKRMGGWRFLGTLLRLIQSKRMRSQIAQLHLSLRGLV